VNDVLAIKGAAMLGAVIAAQAAASDALATHETIILGVHQSVLMSAIVGALTGVLLLATPDPAEAFPQATTWARRSAALAVRAATLGAFVFGYALIASWSVTAACNYAVSLSPAAVPIAGLFGFMAKRLLPTVIRGVEKRTAFIAEGPNP
jgi:hypothetical protein